MVATTSITVPVVIPNLQEGVEQNLCLQRNPTQKSQGVLKQAIVVAKLSFHHAQPVHNSTMTCRISKQLCKSGVPSGGLNENFRTRCNF